MCGPPDVEPVDISEGNSQNYLTLVLLKIKKTLKFAQLLMLLMIILKLELKLQMVVKIVKLLYQEVVYFVNLHFYWLENVMNFVGSSQKSTLSIISVL